MNVKVVNHLLSTIKLLLYASESNVGFVFYCLVVPTPFLVVAVHAYIHVVHVEPL
jgi:hypothetical protein